MNECAALDGPEGESVASTLTMICSWAMRVDYSQLAANYARMSDEEFSQVDRGDLAEQAKPYYDEEKKRRTPGWQYTEPTPEDKAITLARERKQSLRNAAIRSVFASLLLGGLWGIKAGSLSSCGGKHVILWLRRFHIRTQYGFGPRFHRMLHQACKGLGIPMTVQDSAFRFSDSWALTRFFPWGFAWINVLIALSGVGWILLWMSVDSVVVKVSVTAVSATVVGYLVYKGFSRMGYTRLKSSDARQKTMEFVENVRRGRGNYDGVIVFKCEDDFWRETVTLAVEQADAVVIDVTEISENLAWELKTVLERVPRQSILLVTAADETRGGYPGELPSHISAELHHAIGEAAHNIPVYFYPRKPGLFSKTEDLASALIQCLSHAPTRG